MDGATRIPEAAPLDRGQVRFRTLLFRYLAVGFILLATVVVANPGTPGAGADPDPWDYQREQVDVQGRGALNAYARTAVRATACTSFTTAGLLSTSPCTSRITCKPERAAERATFAASP